MAAFVRSQDPNHMITVGSEGFYGASTPELLSNNPGPWGVEMGQDFVTNTNIPQIDFATVHAWPDNWMIPQEKTAAFLDKWVQSHINVSTKALKTKKPVMFEEFGKKLDANQQTAEGIRQVRAREGAGRWPGSPPGGGWGPRGGGGPLAGQSLTGGEHLRAAGAASSDPDCRPHASGRSILTPPPPSSPPPPHPPQLRDPIYASTYDSVEKAIGQSQPIAGSLFWKWAIPVFNRQDPRGPYGVLPTDTTMAYIKEHAQFMKRKLNSVPPVRGRWMVATGGSRGGRASGLFPSAGGLFPRSGSIAPGAAAASLLGVSCCAPAALVSLALRPVSPRPAPPARPHPPLPLTPPPTRSAPTAALARGSAPSTPTRRSARA
jgi:hypothetical protein